MNQKLTILISTYNGEKYLKEQIDSLYNQTCKEFQIIVRDDGSTDNTIEILKRYDIEIIDSDDNLGAKESFAKLLEFALGNNDSNYFMFCDQDDVWENNKIEKTLKKMKMMEERYSNTPILIHTNLSVVDEKLNLINNSFWNYEYINPKLNSLNRLLLRNTVTGCTIMINKKLAQFSLPIPQNTIMHDWWIGLVASKFGKIAYLDEPTIKYRQHENNAIGAKKQKKINIFKYAVKLFLVFKKEHRVSLKNINIQIIQAKAFLDRFEDKVDTKTKNMLIDFISLKQKKFWQKRKIIFKHKLYKQGLIENLKFLIKL